MTILAMSKLRNILFNFFVLVFIVFFSLSFGQKLCKYVIFEGCVNLKSWRYCSHIDRTYINLYCITQRYILKTVKPHISTLCMCPVIINKECLEQNRTRNRVIQYSFVQALEQEIIFSWPKYCQDTNQKYKKTYTCVS